MRTTFPKPNIKRGATKRCSCLEFRVYAAFNGGASNPKHRLLPAILLALLLCLTTHGQVLPVLWEHEAGAAVDSCAAIDSNGVIYVTCSGSPVYSDASSGKLIALGTNGVEQWAFKTASDIHSSPAIGPDGTIYFGCRDRKFYAIHPDGSQRWSFPTGAWVDSSAAIGTNGDAFFGSWDGKFYAMTADGHKKWDFATGGPIDSSPAIALDGTIYFGSHDKKFYALNPDGRKQWEFSTAGAIVSSPAITGEGLIYFTSVDGNFYALNPDGKEKWHVWTGGVRSSSPVVDAKGNIYIGLSDLFVALSPAGAKLWDYGHPVVDGAPAISADGTIYFNGYGDNGDYLHGWNPDGTRKNTTFLGVSAASSPAIGKDGTVYIGAGSGPFHAFPTDAGGLARSAWPKFRGDAAQTGRAHAQ